MKYDIVIKTKYKMDPSSDKTNTVLLSSKSSYFIEDERYTWKPLIRTFKNVLSSLGFTQFDDISGDELVAAIEEIIYKKNNIEK